MLARDDDTTRKRAKHAVQALVQAVKRLEDARRVATAAPSAPTASLAPAMAHRPLSALVAHTAAHPRYKELYGPLDRFALAAYGDDVLHREDEVYGIDCEMVACVDDDMALARVSIVRASSPFSSQSTFDVALDVVVMPVANPSFIVDTRESVTGLTKEALQTRGVPIDAALRQVQALFAQCRGRLVLVGHALEHDLLALRMRCDCVVDTALLVGVEGVDPARVRQTHSLASLAQALLGDDALDGRGGRGGKHDSAEDATLALRVAAALTDTYAQAPRPLALPRLSAKAAAQRGSGAARVVEVQQQRIRMAAEAARR